MIYIFREAASDGAVALAQALEGRKVRHFPNRVRPGDALVCWGEEAPKIEGVKSLNIRPISNKYEDALKLKEAGVPTVEVAQARPQDMEPVQPTLQLGDVVGDLTLTLNRHGVGEMVANLQKWLHDHPEIKAQVWLGRRNNHVGGRDLVNPPVTPDYWSRKEDLVEEYRIHSFLGKSIRAGVKVPRDGYRPHDWIRSLDSGWRIRYDGFNSTKDMKELAAKAVKALGLDFGAVDLARRTDGSLLVLEVNRAPGLDGNTITAYANAIRKWLEG